MATAGDSDRGGTGKDRRRLNSDEAHLWRRATVDVRPLTRPALLREPASEQPPPHPPAQKQAAGPVREANPARPAPAPEDLVHGRAAGLDKRTLMRLRRGLMAPEAEIDLHRQTQDAARRLLDDFLAASQAAGRRCVLVITGKGYGSGGPGVLKTMVPRWLNEQPNRARVLVFCYAVPSHGGEGALYVLLRRARP